MGGFVGMVLVALLFAGMACAAEPPKEEFLPPAPEGQQWKLVWNDEFDGTELDQSKWDIPEYKRRDAWWSRKAVALDGQGNLVMKTLKEGEKYYDACVRTKGKFEHAFGYYVAKMKIQKQPGHWSAFWLYNDCVGKVDPELSKTGQGGRDGTEIDIMEKPWLDERVQHTLHWDGYGKDHQSKGNVLKVPGVMEGWHTFSALWTPDEYVFYVDGKETWRTKAGGVCQAPLYLKVSDEAQMKGWAGELLKAQLPDEFLVDYVRVYDLVDTKSGKPAYPVPAESVPKPK
jgi:beta-glucanase (GH16 family)